MRTTVTLDPDTEALLKEETRRSGRSFKVVLNEAVRQSLGRKQGAGGGLKIEPLFKHPFPSDLSAANFNRVANEWDDEATLRELSS